MSEVIIRIININSTTLINWIFMAWGVSLKSECSFIRYSWILYTLYRTTFFETFGTKIATVSSHLYLKQIGVHQKFDEWGTNSYYDEDDCLRTRQSLAHKWTRFQGQRSSLQTGHKIAKLFQETDGKVFLEGNSLHVVRNHSCHKWYAKAKNHKLNFKAVSNVYPGM